MSESGGETGRDAPAEALVEAATDAGADGCTAARDCPKYQACVDGVCGTSCAGDGGPTACNGGCCDTAHGNLCAMGTANDACGGASVCIDCAHDGCSANIHRGLACILFGSDYACGCTANAQCVGCSSSSICNTVGSNTCL